MSEREEVPFFISRLRDETDEAWVHTTLSGEAFLIEDILNVYDEQQETIIVLRAQLTTAERERDEARRALDALKPMVDLATKEGEGMLAVGNELIRLRHRAERAERVVEAANAIYDARNETEDWDARSRLMDALKEYRALDAAEGRDA